MHLGAKSNLGPKEIEKLTVRSWQGMFNNSGHVTIVYVDIFPCGKKDYLHTLPRSYDFRCDLVYLINSRLHNSLESFKFFLDL